MSHYNNKAEPVDIFCHHSAIGELYIACSSKGLLRILLPGLEIDNLLDPLLKRFANIELRYLDEPSPMLQQIIEAIDLVLSGQKPPRVPLDLQISDFEQRVLNQLTLIPKGETRSYKAIAQALERPNASRAVGQACGSNPVPLLIPCHRVIGSRGRLVGFAGGAVLKGQLLAREGALLT